MTHSSRANCNYSYIRDGTSLNEDEALLRMLPAAIDSPSSSREAMRKHSMQSATPDDHTKVTVIAPSDKRTDSVFKEMLESRYNAAPSSSAWSPSGQPALSRERKYWCGDMPRWPCLSDQICSCCRVCSVSDAIFFMGLEHSSIQQETIFYIPSSRFNYLDRKEFFRAIHTEKRDKRPGGKA